MKIKNIRVQTTKYLEFVYKMNIAPAANHQIYSIEMFPDPIVYNIYYVHK